MRTPGRLIGFFGGIAVCVITNLLPLKGLPQEGRLCLGFTLMTVIWWAAQVAQSGYISGVFLMLMCLCKVADPSVIFSGWTESTIWLVPGAYLIASAVQNSGLGERLSYALILRFVRGWKSIILAIFALSFFLSLLIPHPWPRSFLMMSVMSVVIRAANLKERDAVTVGFSVFAASVPTSLIFLTGDANINPLAASYAGEPISFLRWFQVMGPPAILLTCLTLGIILTIFPPSAPVRVDLEQIRMARQALGPMSQRETRSLMWIAAAVLLWMTNGVTGLDIGWITLLIAMMMSMPVIGEVLKPEDWTEVPVHVLLFLTAAIAIGRVGAATGMNQWLAKTILPAAAPGNLMVLVLFIGAASVLIHLFMGSVIAVLGVVIPTFLAFTEHMGISPMVVIGVSYLCVGGHYLLPFHHLNMLVGQGAENGMYTQKETIKMSGPLLIAVLLTVVAAIGWWKMIGLL